MHRFSIKLGLVLSVSTLLFGCANTGENLQANVYKEGQVNSAQEAKVIKILAVLPAKIEVDNSQQQKGAEVMSGLIGAIGGGVLGNNLSHHNASGTAVGAVGGAAGGALVGSLVPGKILVEGVSITYQYMGKTLNSAQVGKLCEFKAGKDAILISTSQTETRVQPNATCPLPTTEAAN